MSKCNFKNFPYKFSIIYTYWDTGTFTITLVASACGIKDTATETAHINRVTGLETGIHSDAPHLTIIPNPFSESTTITCFIHEDSPNSNLYIYNETCSLVKSFKLSKGENNLSMSAKEINSGIYFCKLVINGIPQSDRKMIVVKQ